MEFGPTHIFTQIYVPDREDECEALMAVAAQ